MFRPVTINGRDAVSGQANSTVNIPSLGIEFLGANALSLFISAIETGVIIVLFARFFVRKKEILAIQILVYFVTFAALYVAPFEHLTALKIYFFFFFQFTHIPTRQYLAH